MGLNRTLSHSDALELLKQGKYGVLSTASADATPYGIPLNYFYLPEENAIYFHCATKGRKLDHLRANPRVSFVVIGDERVVEDRFITHYSSVIVEGTASLVADDGEKRKRLLQLCEALAPTATERREAVIAKYLPAVAIVRIKIRSIRGKRNRDD